MTTTSKEILRLLTYRDETPCFVFDRNYFDGVCKDLRSAFQGRDFINGYSVKTNNALCIMKAALENFGYLEIVSKDELDIASNAGAKFNQIIYNGVLNETEYRFKVANAGGIVNIDNLMMFNELCDLAEKKKKKIKLGIRVNCDIGNGLSRFGVLPDSEEWKSIFARKSDYVEIVGFAFHRYGGRNLDGWSKKLKIVSSVINGIRNLEYVDLGSNFYGAMDKELAEQFSDVIPTFKDYALQITSMIPKGVKIIMEAGTPVIGNSVFMFAKVTGIKKIQDENVAICDTSIFDVGFIADSKLVPYKIIPLSYDNAVNVKRIYGYACTENDVLVKDCNKNVHIGDLIVFKNCGAYSYTQSSDFICKKPKIKEVRM